MARHPVMVRQVCRLHPFESESQPSLRMVAEVLWLETGLLELTFNLQAKSESDALKDLKVTTAESLNNEANGERQDNLWKHTCFEAFSRSLTQNSIGSSTWRLQATGTSISSMPIAAVEGKSLAP